MTTTLTCNHTGVRLDIYITENLSGLTRSAVQKLLETECITLNNAPVRKNHITSEGETYTIIQKEPCVSVAVAQNIRLDIVYEDSDLIVINKPRGLVVHPSPGHPDGTLVNALLFHCGDSLSGIGGVMRPGIIHRIDKDTSGLIIAAKNDRAHLSLSAQLAARTLTREYDTIACGKIKNDTGIINVSIGRHPTDRKKQKAYSPGETHGNTAVRHAITHYTVLARYSGYTYVRCQLETGRTHQIRVHLAYIGHPVLGDFVYGRKKTAFDIHGQCLHARRLNFTHPASGEQVDISTDLPDYFRDIIDKLERKEL